MNNLNIMMELHLIYMRFSDTLMMRLEKVLVEELIEG